MQINNQVQLEKLFCLTLEEFPNYISSWYIDCSFVG